MTRTFKQRALFTLVVTTLAAALSAVGGYLLGCAITLRASEDELDQFSMRVQGVVTAFGAESMSLVTAANTSPYPYCSDAELSSFRILVFRAKYARDIGHMRHGKIECSAILGRLVHPLAVSPPLLINTDGTRIYRHLPPIEDNHAINDGLQKGNAYVLLTDYRFSHLSDASMHFFRTATDLRYGRTGLMRGVMPDPNIDRQLLTKDGEFWKNGNLYATHCFTIRPSCTTTYISVRQALQLDRTQITSDTLLGGLIGFFIGIFCSLLYRRSLSMERQLRRAIRKDQLQVVYQPIVELVNRQIVEAEALLRWTDEDGFAISPDVFVRLAEERGFVGELTELVVRHVLRDFGAMLRRHPEFRVNINITASDLADAKFLPMIEQALAKAQVAACSLAIEVTESSTASKQVAQETIHQLRQWGHSVQIDDFGTGYSSLSYLHNLAVDAIKIDRAFTRAIGTEAVTVGILPQILAIANALNLQVIAEGIETVEQAAYFAGSEMPILGQGWLFGRPVPAKSFFLQLAEVDEKARCTKSTDDADWTPIQ